jgi:hypothetical protein
MVSLPVVGVLLLMLTLVQAVPPMVTAVVTLLSFTAKPVPTIVSAVPPAVVPVAGVMDSMVGTGIVVVFDVAVY